ncbi:MAG: glycosyltransferase [Verrucomicrobiales bacterium]|nr:glycosyltransferase [Verrucomicrobiales bacterium]
MNPIVVADTHALWIRLPFEQLGQHTPVVGLKPSPSWQWWQNKTLAPHGQGYREARLALPPRAFGRLGKWFAPLAALQIRRICGRPKAMVYTFPVHRTFLRWFPKTPSFYYASDDYSQDYGFDQASVLKWEMQLVRQVNHVFAVSAALADHLATLHKAPREKFTVIPNGFPQAQIPDQLSMHPTVAPDSIPAHFRPLIGVLGGINRRLRLDWIAHAVEALPWSYWAFVGPVGDLDESASHAMARLQSHPRCVFVGHQPYETLFRYAPAFDLAVMPFQETHFNSVCSPVRFFTQLPSGRPIIATSSCRQLAQDFGDAVTFVPNEEGLIDAISKLRSQGFSDRREQHRWNLSRCHTWERRGNEMYQQILQTLCSF